MSKKVYEIRADYDFSYFSVNLSRRNSFDSRLLSVGTECSSWKDDWLESSLVLKDRRLKKGDLSHYPSHILIVSTQVVNILGDFFDEVLPAKHRNKRLWVINTTRCIDCIDHNYREGVLRIKRFGLDCKKLPEGGIFKILGSGTQLHVVTDDREPKLNFISKLQDNNLRGIRFELIWECK